MQSEQSAISDIGGKGAGGGRPIPPQGFDPLPNQRVTLSYYFETCLFADWP